MGSEYDAIMRIEASINSGYINLDLFDPDDELEILVIRKALYEYLKNHRLGE